jgi:hypothetical protein
VIWVAGALPICALVLAIVIESWWKPRATVRLERAKYYRSKADLLKARREQREGRY